jgi:hypothetical protein
MLWPEVQEHVLGLEIGLREVGGKDGTHGRPPIHSHLRIAAEGKLDGFLGHVSLIPLLARYSVSCPA